MKRLIVLFFVAQLCVAGNSYHVTLTGSPSGTGSITSPLDARTAQMRTSWQPGDTIWIHGGTYVGNGWQFMASGSPSLPVVFRNWNNERVVFSDNIGNDIIGYDKGNDCWLWGLEFVSTVAVENAAGVQMAGTRAKMINCFVHDTQTTGTTSQQSEGTEIYGTIFQYCGRFIPPPPASVSGGYSIYTQNIIGAGFKWVNDCILEWSYGPSLHVYTQGATISNMGFDGNVAFGSGYLWRANESPSNERWEANFLAGSTGIPGDNLVLTNNIFYHDRRYPYGKNFLTLYTNCTNATLRGNRFISPNNGIAFELDGSASVNADNFVLGGTNLPAGTNNTFLSSWPSTRATEVILRPNKYEAGRANITVLNWQGLSSVSINLSSVLAVGSQYRLVDAMNLYGPPVASGTYTGGSITVSMAPGPVATPLGNPAKGASETIDFRVFVLLGSGGQQPPPPPVQLPTATVSTSPQTLPFGGGPVTVFYTSSGATSGSISPLIGAVTLPSGSRTVTVSGTTTFVGSFTNSAGTFVTSATITVSPQAPPPIGNCDTAYNRGLVDGLAGIQAARDSAYQQGYLDGKASQPPVVVTWDSLTYTWVNGQAFPASNVILPKGAIVVARSYNATAKILTVFYLKPKLTP